MDTATMVWNGNPLEGGEAIIKFLDQLPTSEHTIDSLDCQPIPGTIRKSLNKTNTRYDHKNGSIYGKYLLSLLYFSCQLLNNLIFWWFTFDDCVFHLEKEYSDHFIDEWCLSHTLQLGPQYLQYQTIISLCVLPIMCLFLYHNCFVFYFNIICIIVLDLLSIGYYYCNFSIETFLWINGGKCVI